MEDLERMPLQKAGIPAGAIEGFLNEIEKEGVHLHSFVIVKGEKVVVSGSYAPCKTDDIHMLFSLSKSFTSIAIGFAQQEGKLSLQDLVIDFFQEELQGKEISENMKKVTIRHLLTMNSGQTEPEDELFTKLNENWALSFLTSEVEKEPGTWFLYNTRCSYMLSVILEKVTGEKLKDYLKSRLFRPLGFSEKLWWETSPQGYHTGGFGLNISVEDIAKFGIFVKNQGVWKDKQLLNKEWFVDAVKPWSDSSNTWGGENCFGYGYQFWRCHVPGVFRGDGAFGQYCVIMPEEDLVFATTAGQLDMQKILDAFWKHVYPGTALHPALDGGKDSLQERIDKLVLPTYYQEKLENEGFSSSDLCRLQIPEKVQGITYEIPDNTLQLTEVRFWQKEGQKDSCMLEMKNGEKTDTLVVFPDKWSETEFHIDENRTDVSRASFREGLFQRCFVKGCTVGEKLYLDMFFPETTFQDTWEVTFETQGILLDVHRNTGFVPGNFTVRGKAK